MGNEREAAAQVINGQEEAHVISAAAADDYDDVKLIGDAIRALPPHAVKDLLSIGVCIRCIFRLFGLCECSYYCASLPPSILGSVLWEIMSIEGQVVDINFRQKGDLSSEHPSQESEIEPNFCRICLGILQFAYCDEKEILVRDCASDFALLIAKMVKQEGHEIDNFSLEVSVPPSIMENEEAVCLYMKRKYESELWFREKFLPERISAKDVLKLSITNPLEKVVGVRSDSSSFRIRLTYTHSAASIKSKDLTEWNECNKRRRMGAADDSSTIGGSVISSAEHSDISTGDEYVTHKSTIGLQNQDLRDHHKFQLEKVQHPCSLTLLCNRTPIYIGGRYLKYSRNVSQTRWIIDDERMGEASVEEIISSNVLPMFKGDTYKFHAAGREDIDVRMLGSGRPFLLEIQNARHVPSEVFMKEIEGKINKLENKLVRVKNLKVLDSEGWTLMREGEAEKQKQYAALVWISRSLKDDDIQTLNSVKDMQILQRTPVRVLHRRSPLEREKVIHWMEVERISGSSQYFLLHLCTQAGTYIKEFVHGDLGRTHPSIGTILGCRAEILQLDVTNVKMDCFLAE